MSGFDFASALSPDVFKEKTNRRQLMQKTLLGGLASSAIDPNEAVPALKKMGLDDFVIKDYMPSSLPPPELEGLGGGAPERQDAFAVQERSLIGATPGKGNKFSRFGATIPSEGNRGVTAFSDDKGQIFLRKKVDGKITLTPAPTDIVPTVRQLTGKNDLTLKEITTLSDVGKSVEQFDTLIKSFKPEFGGWGLAVVGDVVNFAKRKFGDKSGQALWWQNQRSTQNVERNKLFGSALTATEKIEYERTSINPGDHPDIILGNLIKRREIAARAANKIANSLRAKGKTEKQVRAALGGAAYYLDIGAGQTTKPATKLSPSQMSDDDLIKGLQ